MEPLFGLTFTDLTMIGPADMARGRVGDSPHAMAWEHPRARVVLRVDPQPDRVLFRAEVTCRRGAVLHVAVPFSFILVGRPLERVLWPQVLGVELLPPFLRSERQLWQDYPPLFCDLAAAELGGSWVYVYRCESQDPVRPSVMGVLGGARPTLRHFYAVHVREGETWTSPAVACQVGGDLRETLLRYKRECGLGRGLREKLSPEFRRKWGGMAESALSPPFARMAATAAELPLPAIVEPATWMSGGFDRKYPDFLPPREEFGGEAGFRRFTTIAHEHGHLVRPYVNYTWWCAGWEGEGSEPAPSLAKYGDSALSRDSAGALVREQYGPNFGYRVTPSHPLAVRTRLGVRDSLLDDYGVDYLYLDQLGGRTWLPDYNSALANPAGYGAALMATGREDAARSPIETEMGSDQVLSAVSAMNFWCLPPMATAPSWPGAPPPPEDLEAIRPFPFGLLLSTGDAVVSIPDTRAPERLAWSLLLGGRVSLGWAVDERVSADPERARTEFLQRLARAMGEDILTDRLVSFGYLAPRVCRSVFERHSVVANFGRAQWRGADGAAIAPGGWELIGAAGLRAGRYLDVHRRPVDVLLAPGEPPRVLAPRGLRLTLSHATLWDPETPPPATVGGRGCMVFDAGAALGGNFSGGITGDNVREAFISFEPETVGDPSALLNGLGRCRVVVNANPECLPCPSLGEWPRALARIREWCEAGGVWAEIGGYPFWTAAAPSGGTGGGWERKQISQAGLEDLAADRCQLVEPAPPAETITATDLGRAVLSPAAVTALESTRAVADRPLLDVSGAMTIARGPSGPYITVRPVGHGAVARIGGVPSRSALRAVAETVLAVADGRLSLGTPAWRTVRCVVAASEAL